MAPFLVGPFAWLLLPDRICTATPGVLRVGTMGDDIGAGPAWSDPDRGIEVELNGRRLLTDEDGSFRERGVAGSIAWDPRPGTELGPSLALRQ